MNKENEKAWSIWGIANQFDRPIGFGVLGPISTTSMLNLCEQYDATFQDFEKIQLIEKIIWPTINKTTPKNQEAS